MRTKQQKIPAIFLPQSSSEDLASYIDKNYALFANKMLFFAQPVDSTLSAKLKQYNLLYHDSGYDGYFESKKELNKEAHKPSVGYISRSIRSGERILHEGDLIIAADIKDGALVETTGSLTLFGKNQGDIVCHGNYLIMPPSKRGKVQFANTFIQDKLTFNGLQLATLDHGQVVIRKVNETDHYC